ncbi:MAG: CHAT domain-containing protein [Symploca sp. SIO2D2]|nr:CHAT domain-containing protein [Symploca sp. SIO2D2]
MLDFYCPACRLVVEKVVATVFPLEKFPQDWADTQNNLGAAYKNRIKGEIADNLELAIAAYNNALQIHTKSAFPQQWAATQYNLGNAYCDRIKGDKADNLEQGIAAYKNTLQIYTKSAFPQQWAMTQYNLGAAYRNRIKGERADNLEQGIAAYKNALQIRTPENFPLDCLQTARNLGNLALENNNWQLAIQGYALAIQAVEQSRNWAIDEERRQEIIANSIEVYNKIVQACLNLGDIEKAVEYTERSRAQRLVDMMASNELYQEGEIAPEVEQHLQDYEELQQRINVLRFGAVPVLAGSSHERMSLGMGVKQSHQSLTKEALLAYEEEIQTLEAQKQQVWQQLRRYDPVLAGQVQVEHLHWEQMQQLIEEPTTALLSFYTTNEDTYIFVLLKDRSPQVFTCEGQGVDELQNWSLDNWLIPYIESKDKWKGKMGDFLQELVERLQLEKLVEKYLNGIEELIIVPHIYLHQIPFAALPMKAEGRGQKAEGKEEEKAGGRRQEAEGKEEEKAEKEERIALDQTRGLAFNSKSSKSSTTKHITKTTYLGDRFRIRLIPSCQILHYCHQRPPIEGQQMGIVEDATEDLPFTNFECETLAQIYQVPSEQRLQGRKATVKSYQKLAQQVQILHSSHHAKSNPMQPLESQLSLGDGSLTLGQLLTPSWRMPNLSEVFACACEVNFTVTEVTDDLLTLATGFLCAGARSVVSTQWSVEDLASALLAIFYYKNRKAGMSCSQALQQGQIKLRKLTGEDFVKNYQAQLNSDLAPQKTKFKTLLI